MGHISKRSLHTMMGLVLALVVLFFAITRTQVGRDSLARQLESRFASATNGSLSIGLLTGNVRQDLFAANVTIRNPQGQVAARIDSVIIRPEWSSLLRKEFSIHEVTLLRPSIDLAHALPDSASWSTLTPSGADSLSTEDVAGSWTFKNARFQVEGGSVTNLAKRTGTRVTTVKDIQARAIASWESAGGQVDILGLRATLPDQDVTIEQASSQMIIEEERWFLNQLVLQTASSFLQVRGAMDRPDSETSILERFFQVELEPSDLDFDEVRRIIPGFPLADRARVSAYVSGPITELTVPWIRLERGDSKMSIEGTAVGFPDSLNLELSLSDGQLYPEDLQAWLPESRRLRDVQAGITDLQLYTSGTVQLDALKPVTELPESVSLRSSFDVRSSGGMVSGSLVLDGSVRDSLAHQVTLRLESLDGYPWTSRARWRSSVSGYATLTGSTAVESASTDSSRIRQLLVDTQTAGMLSDVTWAGRRADSLRFDLGLVASGIRGDVHVHDRGGAVRSSLELTRDDNGVLELAFQSAANDFNVGRLAGRPGIRSAINARFEGTSRLTWNRAFEAYVTADVDSSRLEIENRVADVPPHFIALRIQPPESESPVLSLTSDMADLSIESDISFPTMVSLSRAWISAVNAALDEEERKLLGGLSDESVDPERQLDQLLTAEAALDRFPPGLEKAHSSVQLRLHSGEMMSALSPSFPQLDGAGVLDLDATWSADSLITNTTLTSDHFRFNGVTAVAPRMEMAASIARGTSVLTTLSSRMVATSDSVSFGGTSLATNRISWHIGEGQGRASLVSGGTDRVSSMAMQAEWNRRDAYNEVRITDILLDTGNGAWSIEQPATFGLYGDASTLDALDIAFRRDGAPTGQSVFAGGVLSASTADSMIVAFEDLELRPLSEFMEWRRVLGGLVNAELVVRGGYRQPQVAGDIRVDTLSLDHNILGNLSFTSDYVASRPEVAVQVNLEPIAPDSRAVLFGTELPGDIIQNELNITGDIRLPGSLDTQNGSLNLTTTIDQADVFWLKYIFPDVLGSVSGFLSGEGRITGDFSYPIFDARLGVVDGMFDIPYTQTTYAASGALRLDEEAIHFEPLRLVDETGGQVDVSGRLLFNDYTSFTFDMEGTLDEFQIMNVAESEELPFYGFIWASGDIELTGPLFNARLVSTNGRTTDNSELFIPIVEETTETDLAFIVFEDTPGVIPDFRQLESRSSILQRRPTSERQFLDGLNLDLNIDAPPGSIVHLVIDPLLGDVINAVSAGNVQLVLENDEFQVFGRLDVTSGDYQFTAGELFIKTFLINPGGFIEWSGDPINATLNIPASYRTRASRAGLPGAEGERPGVIPLIVDLQIGGKVESPEVALSLAIDRSNQNVLGEYQALEALLNQPDRATEYATSVLILNSFQLTTENITADSGGQLAFNSVSQLVTAQLNRFLQSALPKVDFSLGLQGESAQDLDVTYGVALRLLNERLIIRGEGVYQGARSTENIRTSDGLQGEFEVEIRVGPHVSVEVFFRRESDILETTQLTNTAGVGISYQTEFESWRSIIRTDVQE